MNDPVTHHWWLADLADWNTKLKYLSEQNQRRENGTVAVPKCIQCKCRCRHSSDDEKPISVGGLTLKPKKLEYM